MKTLTLLLAAALQLTALALHAGSVVYNLTNTVTSQIQCAQGYTAQAFDTRAAATRLSSITLKLSDNSGTAAADVQLWTSAPSGTRPTSYPRNFSKRHFGIGPFGAKCAAAFFRVR